METCLIRASARDSGEASRKETVILLHGSAGTGGSLRQAFAGLEPSHEIIAPDLIGYGRSAAWPIGVDFDVDAELRALAPVLPCCGAQHHLVGYSYGGVVALHWALANPGRVRTLTLIEPVFVAALRHAGDWAAYRELCRVRDVFTSLLTDGAPAAAMQHFVDFWTGAGAWERLPAAQQTRMLQYADKILLDWHAAFMADADAAALAVIGPRTALIRGDRSPVAMHRLVDALHARMPGSLRLVVPGASHLLPFTHAATVIRAILLRRDAPD